MGTTTLVAGDAPRCLPPITAELARRIPGPTSSDVWWSSWARWFTQQLLFRPDASPLSLGSWRVAPCSPAAREFSCAEHLEKVATQLPVHEQRWDYGRIRPPLALRELRSFGHARVKAWRRAAREGCLPPLALVFVTGLDRYVILDGHDRLAAALAEGMVAPALAFVPVRSFPHDPEAVLAAGTRHVDDANHRRLDRQAQVEWTNRNLVRAFNHDLGTMARTRAWPLSGGVIRWDEEVRNELAARGFASDCLA
jgi:hypothetical protein